MMIDPLLLDILCCPETHQDLVEASAPEIELINRAILTGQIKNRTGSVVTEIVQGVLLRSDRQILYPVRDGIPVMLIDESISCLAIPGLLSSNVSS
jgi:uncharacterized protein